jgi:hypothetical protein
LRTGAAGQPGQAEGDVLADGEVGEQRVVLKDHPDMATLGRHRPARSRDQITVEVHLTGVEVFQTSNET